MPLGTAIDAKGGKKPGVAVSAFFLGRLSRVGDSAGVSRGVVHNGLISRHHCVSITGVATKRAGRAEPAHYLLSALVRSVVRASVITELL